MQLSSLLSTKALYYRINSYSTFAMPISALERCTAGLSDIFPYTNHCFLYEGVHSSSLEALPQHVTLRSHVVAMKLALKRLSYNICNV